MTTTTSQLNFPTTKSWLNRWEWNPLSTDTSFGLTLNSIDFTISPINEKGYGQQGNMSVKKQIKNNTTTYWWGYSTQVNFKTALNANEILQNWMSIYG